MKRYMISLLAVLAVLPSAAQSWLENHNETVHIKNPNLYCHVDINSGNVYTMALATVATGYINYGIKRNLFETAFVVDLLSAENDGEKIKTKINSPLGLTMRELFNDINPVVKIGYKSNSSGLVNWGIYASAQYKLHQFRADCNGDYERFRYQRVGFGGGLLGFFGRLSDPFHVVVEAGASYSIPVAFSTSAWDSPQKSQLGKGLTSHFAVKFGGSDTFQNIGVFVDIDHFDLFDKKYESNGGTRPFENMKFKNICLGVSMSVTFGQADNR